MSTPSFPDGNLITYVVCATAPLFQLPSEYPIAYSAPVMLSELLVPACPYKGQFTRFDSALRVPCRKSEIVAVDAGPV